MLGRLIKYEWKNLWKVESILAGIMAAFALMEAVMLQTPMFANLFLDNKEMPDVLEGLSITSMIFGAIFLALLIIGVLYGSMIFLGVRFYRSMYCDEGYLTHTLPVTKKELLGAKLITGMLWQIIMNVVAALSIAAIFTSITALSLRNGMDMTEVADEYTEIYTDLVDLDAGVLFHGTVTTLLTGLFEPFISISLIYGAITLAQLLKKNRGFMGIVFYFLINFVIRFVLTIFKGLGYITLLPLLDEMDSYSEYMNRSLFSSYDMRLILYLGVAIALVVISHYIIEQKLNLQ
ncbi:MAG: hypothetical protein IJ608_10820 [Lachnospiraceae bacterium]|nr:hypothetical protein [Lachnospiraceae bacterium]